MNLHEQPTEQWQGKVTGQQGQSPLENEPTLVKPKDNGASASATIPARKGFSRRTLFIGLAGAGVAAATSVAVLEQVVASTSSAQGSVAGNVQIGHLLRRAGFGLTPEELADYSKLGYNGAVEQLLNYQQVSDDQMENRLKALNLDLSKVQNQQQWWLLRMAWTKRPLLEKMTLFWSGHFTSSFRKVGGPKSYSRMMTQNEFLRDHAFDTFDNLLLGITRDPAMLVYLDLTKSKKNAPNENYARELMELFTLGIGHYSQQDVYEAAVALTGWHVKNGSDKAIYNLRDHSQNKKSYLGQSSNFDYKDIVRILANHPATPVFIARKLFTFFAYENPSDADIQPLVDAYHKSNHNMGAVMRALLLSPQFSSEKAYRSRVKSPTEFVVGVYRALNVQGDGKGLPYQTTTMGQPLFDPPNVAGWPGDKTSSLWLNSGTWMARLNYIDLLLTGGKSRTTSYKELDLQSVVNTYKLDSPDSFIDHFAAFLLDGKLEPERRTQLIDYLQTPDTAESKGGKSAGAITLVNGKSYPRNRVRGALYLLLSLPEYQLN